MSWFRMYAEFAVDPKVQMMDEALQRRFVMLLCIRCGNVSETFHGTFDDAQIAFQLRISDDEVKRTKSEFLARNLIDETWRVRAWDKRQFVADSSTARVRKHRAKVKRYSNATLERKRNVTVTPPDTDTDTETEEEKARSKPLDHRADDRARIETDFDTKFWPAYPRKVGKVNAQRAFTKLKPDEPTVEAILAALEREKRSDPQWLRDGGQFIPHPATWLNGRRWEDEVGTVTRIGADPLAGVAGVVR